MLRGKAGGRGERVGVLAKRRAGTGARLQAQVGGEDVC